jgi:hypothetical protein
MPASLTREEMRLYQQSRRARLKAEAEAAGLSMAKPMPKDHPLAPKRRDAIPSSYAGAPAERPTSALRRDPVGRELAVYKPLPATPSMVAGRMVKPAPKRVQGMVASGGTPPGPPLDIVITHWQLGHLMQTRNADLAEIAAWKRAYELERNHAAELEREKSAKAASQAKLWAEAQRLFFNMIRPQPL